MPTPAPRTPRIAAKRALFTHLKAGEVGLAAEVFWSWPAEAPRRGIVLGVIQGNSEIANIKAGRLERNHTFNLDLSMWVNDGGGLTGETAEEECELLAHAVDSLLADKPKLDGTVPGLLVVTAGKFDGPDSVPVTVKGKRAGWQAMCSIEVGFEFRLT